ncbi:MAG: hypothetical protein WCF85_18175 [Rhodospirillaceae bacterium]
MSEPRDAADRLPDIVSPLQSVNRGDDLALINGAMNDLIALLSERVTEYGGIHKAQLTVTFAFAADPGGVDLLISSKITPPKRPVGKDRMFISDRADLRQERTN